VILTRFSRVTFNAAHKYLGLTSEVLRTEKAINDIACHPLPASFYQMGGLQLLRQRFDAVPTTSPVAETDYISVSHSSAGSSKQISRESSTSSKTSISDKPVTPSSLEKSQSSPFARSSRTLVQAGDLHVPSGYSGEYNRTLPRSYSLLQTPRVPRSFDFGPSLDSGSPRGQGMRSPGIEESFDLREEVMSCIAKSIGLLQPPLSGGDSTEPSPILRPTDPRRPSESFSSPFGSLSLLDAGDDSSSVTAGSTTTSSGGYMSGLDNEVEILYYAAGSTLAKAGELNTGELWSNHRVESYQFSSIGLFYVIEGFLDILMPTNGSQTPGLSDAMPGLRNDKVQEKLLFTVKPGGIAGYLCKKSLRSFVCNSDSVLL
jgi:lysophospholipid hydrolase